MASSIYGVWRWPGVKTPTASQGVVAMASVRVVKQADLGRPVISSASSNASGDDVDEPNGLKLLRQRHLSAQVLTRASTHANRDNSQRGRSHDYHLTSALADIRGIAFTGLTLRA